MKKLLAIFTLLFFAQLAHAEGDLAHSTLGEVEKSEFFTFFNLVKVQEQKSPKEDEGIYIYSTSGQFKGAVTLIVEFGKEKNDVRSLGAIITRQFIDSSATGMFARDYARSFLVAALSAESAKDAAGFIKEISESAPAGTVRYVAKNGQFALDDRGVDQITEESMPFKVFLGKESLNEWKFAKNDFTIKNLHLPNGTQLLMLAVAPR